MTEQEWLDCADPDPLLLFLNRKASARKRRLFAVACCRRIWHLFGAAGLRQTVLTADRLADEGARTEDWTVCRDPAKEAAKQARKQGMSALAGYYVVLSAADTDARIAAVEAAKQAALEIGRESADLSGRVRDEQWRGRAAAA